MWEKYDRVNKRHKKREEMAAITAEERRSSGRKRRAREREQAAAKEEGVGGSLGMEEDRARDPGQATQEERVGDGHGAEGHPHCRNTAVTRNGGDGASFSTLQPKMPSLDSGGVVSSDPVRGDGRCTFGSGRERVQHVGEAPASSSTRTSLASSSQSCSSAAWGPNERDKLNEICEREREMSLPFFPSC